MSIAAFVISIIALVIAGISLLGIKCPIVVKKKKEEK